MTVPDLKYTVCFCIHGTEVLMIHRRKAPHLNRWNGLGGKIEPGESALANVVREVGEEAGIDLSSEQLSFRGIVTWNLRPGIDQEQGMFVFVAHLKKDDSRTEPLPRCDEGTLAWIPIERACDSSNNDIVDNLPFFLLDIIEGSELLQVRCVYDDRRLIDVAVDHLDPGLVSPADIR